MAFSIISTVASGLAGLFFIIAVVFYAVFHGCMYTGYDPYDPYGRGGHEWDCSAKSVGLGLHVPLLIMMTVEFFVSIVAAAFCCQNGCCNGPRVQGTVILQPQGQVMMMQQPGGAVYPQQYAAQPQYGVAPQYGVVQPQYGAQVPQYATQAVAPSYSQPGYPPPQSTAPQYMEKPPDYPQQ